MFKPQPMYVTRAVQRAWGIEHPIDDPFGGAAYGEKNKGGSIGKVFSSVVPMVAGAAMMIGSGGALAPMVIGGAMFAGGAMSGIGAISGNQTLSKIGNITSAVAGVAGVGYSIYNSEWMTNLASKFSSGAELSGAVNTGAEAATGTMSDIPGLGWNTAAAEGSTLAPTAAGQMTSASTPATFQGAGFNTDAFAGEMANQMNLASNTPLNYNTANSFAGPVTSPINTSATANAINSTSMGGEGFSQGTNYFALQGAPSVNAAAPMASTAANAGTAVANAGTAATGGSSSGGLLSSVGDFIKSNPIPSLMAFQSLSGLAEGASPKSQAEGEYLQAMTAMKQAEQEYLAAAKAPETAANTQYLLEKAAEWDKTKQYEEEKRAAYNASIAALQNPQTQNLAQTMYGGAQNGIINQARA